MKQPLISVIIPLHNTEMFIEECLDSVVSQSYENLEIIIVDDGSTDSSKKIVKKFQNKDSRISYVFTQQYNAAFARREGVRQSNAEFLCFVDSDDVIDRKYVEVLFKALAAHNASMSSAMVRSFTNGNLVKKKNQNKIDTYIQNDVLEYFFNNYRSDEKDRHIAQTINAKMFKRALFDDIDYSPIKTSVLEDNFIVPQLLRKMNSSDLVLVDNVLYYYRLGISSTMSGAVYKLIKYDSETITYSQLFEEAMDYIESLYQDQRDKVIKLETSLKAKEYFDVANRSIIRGIEVETEKEEEITELKGKIEEYDRSMRALLSSSTFKIGKAVTWPIRWIKQ